MKFTFEQKCVMCIATSLMVLVLVMCIFNVKRFNTIEYRLSAFVFIIIIIICGPPRDYNFSEWNVAKVPFMIECTIAYYH